jgi:hypothetical protein
MWVELLGSFFFCVFLVGSKHFSCHWELVWRAWGSAVAAYLINNDSVVLTQWIFLRHLSINRKNIVPSRNSVPLWVRNFRERASESKRKHPGRDILLRTPEDFELVCQVFVRNPRLSASRNVFTLTMSDCTMGRILREDLNLHPYKMFIFQAINDQDSVSRVNVMFFWELWTTRTLTTFSWGMKQIFIVLERTFLKIVATLQNRNLAIFIRNLCNSRILLLGVVVHFCFDRSLFLWRRSRQKSNC